MQRWNKAICNLYIPIKYFVRDSCNTLLRSNKHGLFSPTVSVKCCLRTTCITSTSTVWMQILSHSYSVNTLTSVFKAEKGYSALLTNPWSERYLLLGLGNKNNKSNMSHTSNLKSTRSVNVKMLYGIWKLGICFAALLNCLWCTMYHRLFNTEWKEIEISIYRL